MVDAAADMQLHAESFHLQLIANHRHVDIIDGAQLIRDVIGDSDQSRGILALLRPDVLSAVELGICIIAALIDFIPLACFACTICAFGRGFCCRSWLRNGLGGWFLDSFG